MENQEVDPYEQQLIAVFESCDIGKTGSLDRQGLTLLCEQLQLDEEGAELITNLGGNTEERVTFVEFRKGLLALLNKGKENGETVTETVENGQQSEREISPKFILGKKKYGRRTRPKNSDCSSQTSKDDSDSEVSVTSSVKATGSDQLDDCPAEASSQHPKKRRTTLAVDGDQSSSDDGQQSSLMCDIPSTSTDKVFPLSGNRRVWECSVSIESIIEACEELGMTDSASLLHEFGFRDSHIQLSSLRNALEESLMYPVTHDDIPYTARERLLLSAFALRRFEVTLLEGYLDQFECERAKLRTDNMEAKERACLIAIEVDETHAKLEMSQKVALRALEQRHAETVKQLTAQLAQERDSLTQQHQSLESRVWELEALELQARAKSSAVMEENESLAADNRLLADQLAKAECKLKAVCKELSSVDGMRQAAHFSLMESDKEVMGLKEKVSVLQLENTSLRDLTDELTMKVESLTSQIASMSLKVAIQSSEQKPNPQETMEEICLVTGDVIVPGSATKRRGAPPEHTTSGSEDSSDDETSPRLEKLMRCTVTPQNTSAKGFTIRTPPMLSSSSGNLASTGPTGPSSASSSLGNSPSFIVGDSPEQQHLSRDNARLQAEVKVLTKRVRTLTQKVNRRNEIILDNPEVCEAENNHRLKEFLEQGDFFPSPQLTDTLNQITEECSSNTKDMNECENTKEQLEQHCRDLKSQLDKVKVEIVKILSERNACSKENCALKNHISDLKSSIGHSSLEETDNYYRVAFLSESPSLGTENIPASGEPSLELKSGISEDCLVISDTNVINVNEDRTVNNDESESIFLLKCEFADQLSVVEENHMKEKIELLERCTNLESSIEMLRQEYEKCEDYWASKLEEERVIYDKEQRTLDKKYKKILSELKEYDEFLNEDRPCTCRRLATIQESEKLEYQVTAVEEECEDLRKQLASERAERSNEYQLMMDQLNQQQIRFAAYSGEVCHSIGIQFPEQGTAIGEQATLSTPRRDELQPTGSVDDLRNMLATRDLLSADISALRRQKELLTQSIQEEKNGKYGGGMGCGKQACCVDLTVLQTLNARWRQQEQQCRHLQHALKQRQRHTDMLMQHTWAQHKKEISDLEVVLDTTQKNLHQQSLTCKEQVDRLVRNDVLVKDLYVENAYLVATVQRLEQRCQGLAQMTTDSISV